MHLTKTKQAKRLARSKRIKKQANMKRNTRTVSTGSKLVKPFAVEEVKQEQRETKAMEQQGLLNKFKNIFKSSK
jgi:hypothetical protein